MSNNQPAKRRRLSDESVPRLREAELRKIQDLPVWEARKAVLEGICSNQVYVIVGETGSGKTTQIPKFLHQSRFGKSKIICTQPRRVAAIANATRVAKEMGCKLGGLVGYAVRFDDTSTHETKIRYVTDGLLLREAVADPLLQQYKVIIVDEAHERTLDTDALLGLLKRMQRLRKDEFHIVLMSATLDAGKYASFFPGAEIGLVQGRQHKVDVMYTKQAQESYLDAALTTVLQIHSKEAAGDILAFLTGQEEIDALCNLVKTRGAQTKGAHGQEKLQAVAIYAALPAEQQAQVFHPAPPGSRKVIFATNIAETALTIPGVRYVVDTGVVKQRSYQTGAGVDLLAVVPISKAQARQRSGRAGREAPGKTFRLYTEAEFEKLESSTTPEILRVNLAAAVLQLKALGISDIRAFDFVDQPPLPALVRALEHLHVLGALDTTGELSPCGQQMARLPVDPQYAKILLVAAASGCTEDAAAVVAMASVEQVFVNGRTEQQKQAATQAKQRFRRPQGDHLTALAVLRAFLATGKGKRGEWCVQNCISGRAMQRCHRIFQQLCTLLQAMKLPLERLGDTQDPEPLQRALVCGLFLHAACRQSDGTFKVIGTGQEVSIHPSSVLSGSKPECIVFNELVFTRRNYARTVCNIQMSWLIELVPTYFTKHIPR
ncbi:hypothetical protein WJX74_010344 [Apatococcus lobatus]|uniref:RNA helicase n=1 Tax=Apatococcus lobatus TaxID=904363 RepID=A0AAW1RKZ9_9CHLO